MLVSSKDDTHQPRDVDSFGPVYAGIYWFAIPAGANRGSWTLSYLSMHECIHRHCVSESLLSIMLWVAGGNCVPKVSLVNASAVTATAVSQQMTLPYLTLPYRTLN